MCERRRERAARGGRAFRFAVAALAFWLLGGCDPSPRGQTKQRTDECRLTDQWSIARTEFASPGPAEALDIHGVRAVYHAPSIWVLWSEPSGLYMVRRREATRAGMAEDAQGGETQKPARLGPPCPRGLDAVHKKDALSIACGRTEAGVGQLWTAALPLPDADAGAISWRRIAPLGRDGAGIDLAAASASDGGLGVAFQQGEVGDYRAALATFVRPVIGNSGGSTHERRATQARAAGGNAADDDVEPVRLSREGPAAWAPSFVEGEGADGALVWHEQAYDEEGVVGEILLGTPATEPALVSTTLAAIARPTATRFHGQTWVAFMDQNPSGSKDRLYLQQHEPGFRRRKGSGARHPTLRGIGRVYPEGDIQPLACGERLFPIHTRHYSPDEVYAAVPVYAADKSNPSGLKRVQDEVQLYRASTIGHRVHGVCTSDGLLLATGARVKAGVRVDLMRVTCGAEGRHKAAP